MSIARVSIHRKFLSCCARVVYRGSRNGVVVRNTHTLFLLPRKIKCNLLDITSFWLAQTSKQEYNRNMQKEIQEVESFYETVIFSPQWEKWSEYQNSLLKDYKEENSHLIWDFIAAEEIDEITPEHFASFMAFSKTL